MSEIVPFWSPTGISDVSFPFYHLYCCSEFVFHVVLGLVITFVLFISILVFTIKSTPVNHRLSILCLFWLTLSFLANATVKSQMEEFIPSESRSIWSRNRSTEF